MNLGKLLLYSIGMCFIQNTNALVVDVSKYWDFTNSYSSIYQNKLPAEFQFIEKICNQWITSRRMKYAGYQVDNYGWINGCLHNGQYESWDSSFNAIGKIISNTLNGKQFSFENIDWAKDPNADAYKNGLWMQKFVMLCIENIRNCQNCKNPETLDQLKTKSLKEFYEDIELNKHKNTLHDMHSYIDTLNIFDMITTLMKISILMKQMPEYEKSLNVNIIPIVQNNGYNNCYETSLLQIINALDYKNIDDDGLKNFKNVIDMYKEKYNGHDKLDPRTAFDDEFNKTWMDKNGILAKLVVELNQTNNCEEDVVKLVKLYNEYLQTLSSVNNNDRNQPLLKTTVNLSSKSKNTSISQVFQKTSFQNIPKTITEGAVSSSGKRTVSPKSKTYKSSINNGKQITDYIPTSNRTFSPTIKQKKQSTSILPSIISPKKQGEDNPKRTLKLLMDIVAVLKNLMANYTNPYSTKHILTEQQKNTVEKIIAIYNIYTMVHSGKTDIIEGFFQYLLEYFEIYTTKFNEWIDGYYRSDLNEIWSKIMYEKKNYETLDPFNSYRTDAIHGDIISSLKESGISNYQKNVFPNIILTKAVRIERLLDKIFFGKNNLWINFLPKTSFIYKIILQENKNEKERDLIRTVRSMLCDKYKQEILKNLGKTIILPENVKEWLTRIISTIEIKKGIEIPGRSDKTDFDYKINAGQLLDKDEFTQPEDGELQSIISQIKTYGFTTLTIDEIEKELRKKYINVSIEKYPKVIFKRLVKDKDEERNAIKNLLKNQDYLPVITKDGKIIIYRLRGFVNYYYYGCYGQHYNASIYNGTEWQTIDSYFPEENYRGKNPWGTNCCPAFYVYQQIYWDA